ncbi:S-adenosyl-L-methionine-dependent methyltransferase [Xylariaceae sp. FL0255]|nr:S-adenosyl-L-methionine-dependent methyltransferase [Xylariaceae sp. FL0255]
MQFVPKQAHAPNADLYQEIVGDSTTQIAEEFLKLIEPFPPDAVIHDNGCGSGQVIEKIMETNPPPTIKIEATDIDTTQVDSCLKAASTHGWPVQVKQMPAESLEFPDNTFTHSFSNLLLFATRNTGLEAAQEIYRTLKPGGIAVVTWNSLIPHQEVIQAVSSELRGPDVSMSHGMPSEWYNSELLSSTLEKGGFQPANIRTSTIETHCTIPDLRRWVDIMWSFVGRPTTGWTPSDEEHWEEAIGRIVKGLETSSFYKKDGKGGVMMLKVNICIATK